MVVFQPVDQSDMIKYAEEHIRSKFPDFNTVLYPHHLSVDNFKIDYLLGFRDDGQVDCVVQKIRYNNETAQVKQLKYPTQIEEKDGNDEKAVEDAKKILSKVLKCDTIRTWRTKFQKKFDDSGISSEEPSSNLTEQVKLWKKWNTMDDCKVHWKHRPVLSAITKLLETIHQYYQMRKEFGDFVFFNVWIKSCLYETFEACRIELDNCGVNLPDSTVKAINDHLEAKGRWDIEGFHQNPVVRHFCWSNKAKGDPQRYLLNDIDLLQVPQPDIDRSESVRKILRFASDEAQKDPNWFSNFSTLESVCKAFQYTLMKLPSVAKQLCATKSSLSQSLKLIQLEACRINYEANICEKLPNYEVVDLAVLLREFNNDTWSEYCKLGKKRKPGEMGTYSPKLSAKKSRRTHSSSIENTDEDVDEEHEVHEDSEEEDDDDDDVASSSYRNRKGTRREDNVLVRCSYDQCQSKLETDKLLRFCSNHSDCADESKWKERHKRAFSKFLEQKRIYMNDSNRRELYIYRKSPKI